ncbi:cysteine desulfurase [Amphibacillus marinus]|uniref:cysteine desulfurase n=1 Tax=Amphibacillus marinus TaxID=872970 RepID=A0A1H8NXE4_9BACI|nr:cysteine desulfurase family protein [Amphibacillus marinus]SEO34330.1 cysteine desulfurase [Amphibacillus marinus]
MDAIYLDHAATTPVHPAVIEAMTNALQTSFGNPSSIHSFGRESRAILDRCRRYVADKIGASEKEIYFTSGGTEADNLAIIGVALANKAKGKHIITTQIEHHAVLHAAEHLETLGFEVTYLPVNQYGQVEMRTLQESLRDDTILVSIMMVNNEVGTLQAIAELAAIIKDHQAYFHTDAVQAFGLEQINVAKLGLDLLSVSGHKINGPKGTGFLYAGKGVKFHALQHGGAQERLKRPGTESLPAIVGLTKAIELIVEDNYPHKASYENYRTVFLQVLAQEGITFQVNGAPNAYAPSILNISFPGTSVESLLMNLDLDGIAASSGSACTAGSLELSHVLIAMYGEQDPRTENAIRFSFGLANDAAQIKKAATKVSQIIKRLTKQSTIIEEVK